MKKATNLHRVLYRSEQTQKFGEGELEKILSSAHKNNTDHNITGILIRRGIFFLQLLEGDIKNVVDIFSKIKRDLRHKNIEVLLNEGTDSRVFHKWTMGVIEDSSLSNLPELQKTIDAIIKQKEKDSNVKVIEILKLFTSSLKK
ncbi:BLUF domain-containing protein [Fluviispira sanaruensis]|uniref:Blue-light sensor BLUF n=1 Tax=Fluviispira sanaruensis TaxID=2493639 RepID=A0A4P2VMK4_FLUSA|nr:BLUF domain-containing protein [Fluviispira sanaruensis]BBH53110.1 blue-light sensor BLUF [Fluviispira sanaruensis]